ncbi:hypothetical protein K490DRAFT_53495 [Saccharata proteae CBS 121410]|uniref:Uncharacterized protein n=1 Tax=Saccharata proteae CBS 121410 TaxID=1314787 RepID=A0A9P4HWI8_9PEZI|nr:hypothetical protein K490DRAFT_53495 [Saccharata proteae CBS 121410]
MRVPAALDSQTVIITIIIIIIIVIIITAACRAGSRAREVAKQSSHMLVEERTDTSSNKSRDGRSGQSAMGSSQQTPSITAAGTVESTIAHAGCLMSLGDGGRLKDRAAAASKHQSVVRSTLRTCRRRMPPQLCHEDWGAQPASQPRETAEEERERAREREREPGWSSRAPWTVSHRVE